MSYAISRVRFFGVSWLLANYRDDQVSSLRSVRQKDNTLDRGAQLTRSGNFFGKIIRGTRMIYFVRPSTVGGSKIPIIFIDQEKNQRISQRLTNYFLLKLKLAIGVNIKSVAQITSFYMNGQRALNSISSPRYPQITEKMSKY